MMRLIIMIINALFFWAAFSSSANATQKECSRSEAIQAETESTSLQDWDSMYLAFKKFKQCDDAAIAEGYSDTVGRLLAKDWQQQFDRLRVLIMSDKDFRKFVLHHIDETIPLENLRQIAINAKSQCSPAGAIFCDEITRAAQKSMGE